MKLCMAGQRRPIDIEDELRPRAKRKISPIVWEKQVRISSKNRVVVPWGANRVEKQGRVSSQQNQGPILCKPPYGLSESPIDFSESGGFQREEESERDSASGEKKNEDKDSENDSPSSSSSINMLESCKSVFEYERLGKINEGAYGVVYRARDKRTGEMVALKKVKMGGSKEGFPITSLREINMLSSFHHPSIVDVKQVVVDENNMDSVFIVMEYLDTDLRQRLDKMKQPYSTSEVKCLMLQLLDGVKSLHENWVLHRDLKSSNLLMNNRGQLKICDFGLSRRYGSPLKPYTPLVVTLWYRAPELLLGAKHYSTAIDMWSVGCIMAEMLSKQPLFPGDTEVDQLRKIYTTLGTPNTNIWPGYLDLPGVKANLAHQPFSLLRTKFPATSFTGSPILSNLGFDLLNRLLAYDPDERITAQAALNHDWFREVPLPKSKDFMPTFPTQF